PRTKWICRRLMALAWAFFVLVALLALAGSARAQSFSRLEAGQQTVTAETGLQSGIVTSLGYAAGLRLHAIDRTLMPFAQATMLVARPDLHDYAFRGGAQISVLSVGWFDLSTQLAFDVAETENSIYRGTALRTDLVLLAGHYGRRWFAVAEAGYDRAWLTYIKNSDWYRTYFYSDAKDGWYSGTAGMLHAGAKGGVTLGRVEVVLRAGITKTEDLNNLDLPFYATLGANYRF
ncbi:MAG TPA: hypothetical protein VKQ32_30190, partial [Polyangia bacterium]|nr:hypothetical protein [Polyangia bacterium]